MHKRNVILVIGLAVILLAGCGGPEASNEVDRLKREHLILKTDFQGYIARLQQRIKELEKRPTTNIEKGKKLLDWLREQGIGGVQVRNGEIVVLITADILFDPGKAAIKNSAKNVLRQLGGALQHDIFQGKPIRIEGHTDSDPVKRARKFYKDNWELGSARARAVLDYLTKYGGLDPAKRTIYSASFSRYKPVASNNSKTGKAQNRRVEVVVVMGTNE